MKVEETDLDLIYFDKEEVYPDWVGNDFAGWSLPVVLLRVGEKNICVRSGPFGWSPNTVDIWVDMCVNILFTNNENDNVSSSSSCDECDVNVVAKATFVGRITPFRASSRLRFKI